MIKNKKILEVKIRDIVFPSPIMTASGTFGYGDEVKDFVEIQKIGCIITKSITLNSRKGNPPPRIHESNSGMLNSIGLANIGLEKFCSDKLNKLNKLSTNFMISIAGSSLENYVKVLSEIEKNNGNHVGYEINVSCPNVKKGGVEFGMDGQIVKKLIVRLREITDKLLFVKLSPNVTNIEEIAFSAESAGVDGISAVNTFLGLALDYKTGKFELSTKYGGLSGPAIKPLALAKIHKIYNKVKIPIIGIGGISKFSDIVEFFRVGSTMVQVGTLNYRDPTISCKLFDDLLEYVEKSGFKNIKDLIGKTK